MEKKKNEYKPYETPLTRLRVGFLFFGIYYISIYTLHPVKKQQSASHEAVYHTGIGFFFFLEDDSTLDTDTPFHPSDDDVTAMSHCM